MLIRGWDLILAVCRATSTLVRGETLAGRWLHEPQPVSNQLVGGWGFHTARATPRGALSTGVIAIFVLRLLEL